jgi:endonuclease III
MTVAHVDKETQEEVRQEVRQIIQECKWTDKLQRLVDYGNSYILKSFHLRLEMEEVTK